MTKLIWVAALAVGCGAPFEADLFGTSPDVDGGALDGEITPQGDAMGDATGDALPEVDGGAGGAQAGSGGTGGVAETAGGRSSTGGTEAAGGTPSSGGSDAGTGGSGQASGGSVHTSGGAQSAGGAPSAGGSSSGGAPPCNVLHDNGLGQTWEDCTSNGTHNLEQAQAACTAYCVENACEGVGCWGGTVCDGLRMLLAQVDGQMVGWTYIPSSGTGSEDAGQVWSVSNVLSECRLRGTWD